MLRLAARERGVGRIGRSWGLIRASWAVLRADKELILYPIIGGLAALGASAVLLLPVLWTWLANASSSSTGPSDSMSVGSLLLLFVYYVVTYSITIFFNAALVGAADIRLRGGDPTFSDGMRIATSRLPSILGWAVISATVGVILRSIQERSGLIGTIVVAAIGIAWSLATFLVVPVLVIEGVGPIEAARRSGTLLKQTWGEQVAGNVSIGLVFGIGIFALLLGGGLLAAVVGSAVPPLALAILLAVVGGSIVLGVIGSALASIFSVALYRFAATGDGGAFFPVESLRDAFRQR